MSKDSHNAEPESAGPEIGISVGTRRDTLEGWLLVIVERHFPINWQGRAGSS